MSGFTSLGKKSSGGFGGGGGTNSNAIGPFGTAIVSNLTPAAQAAFTYGTVPNSLLWVTQSSGIGALVSTSEAVMTCSSGTSVSGSSTVELSRFIRYRAGQGVVCRLTSIFDAGSTDTRQLAGAGNKESGYYFGRVGTNFGILHRETSKREIRTFTVTAQNAVTVTVTLAGEKKTFSISGGLNANQTAYLISQADYTQIGSGWSSEALGNTVYFISTAPGPWSGDFDITVSGVTIVSATGTVQAGVLPTDTFITQSLWNIDTMDGNGPSRTVLDPSKGNIYGIGYQYLGFGDPVFCIENPETGLLTDVHRIQTANSKTTVVVRNPQMSARWVAENSGSSATNVSVKGASAGIFNEGVVTRNIGVASAASASKTSIGATAVPVLTIRANKVFASQCCYGGLDIAEMSLSCDAGSSAGNKILKILVYKNALLGGPVNFTSTDSRSFVSVDASATSFSTNGLTQLMKTILVAANSSVTIQLEDLGFFLTSGETLTIVAQRGASSDVDAALVSVGWFEDQ